MLLHCSSEILPPLGGFSGRAANCHLLPTITVISIILPHAALDFTAEKALLFTLSTWVKERKREKSDWRIKNSQLFGKGNHFKCKEAKKKRDGLTDCEPAANQATRKQNAETVTTAEPAELSPVVPSTTTHTQNSMTQNWRDKLKTYWNVPAAIHIFYFNYLPFSAVYQTTNKKIPKY